MSLTAIVTGGTQGIGFAYCETLLSRGYKVCILDKYNAELTAEKLQTASHGANRVYGLLCDVADPLNYQEAFNKAWSLLLGDESATSNVDVIVLNAGIFGNLFHKSEAIINTNLLGVIRGTELSIKLATEKLAHPAPKPMLIAITSSSNGIVPADSDFAPVYVATKFGINGFIYSMKPFHSRFGIRINGIAPVTVRTPLVEPFLSEEVCDFLSKEGRGGVLSPQDCADALLHLIDDASINGQVLTVHPEAGPGGRPEPVDPSNYFSYLGIWSEDESTDVKEYVDLSIDAIIDEEMPGWSGI